MNVQRLTVDRTAGILVLATACALFGTALTAGTAGAAGPGIAPAAPLVASVAAVVATLAVGAVLVSRGLALVRSSDR